VTSLRLFFSGALLQYRAMFNWGHPVAYISYKVLFPISQMVFFVQLGVFATGHANALYVAVGNALQVTAVNGIFGVVMTVGNERQYGTLPLLLASPANRLATFMGRAFFHVVDGMTSVILAFAVATVLFGLDLGRSNLALLAACIILISMTTSGLGLMFGSLSLITRDVFVIANTVYYLLLVLCGINFSVSRLPSWAQVISNSLPMTHGVAAARQAVAGASFGGVIGVLAEEAATGAIYVAIGYLLFRWFESRSRFGGLQEAA
jgi:ABC-2 type transport system permease protein